MTFQVRVMTGKVQVYYQISFSSKDDQKMHGWLQEEDLYVMAGCRYEGDLLETKAGY